MDAPGPALPTKSRVFVTGAPGVGKTTLIINVLDKLRKNHSSSLKIQGFYTQELRDAKGERVGFEAITVDGRKALLATLASRASLAASKPKVGKYAVEIARFESVVNPQLALDQHKPDCSELFVIDEVGKMELFSPAFFPAVWEVLNSRAAAVLATIPLTKYGREIAEVEKIKNRADVAVYTLTENSRETVAKEVFSHLASVLRL